MDTIARIRLAGELLGTVATDPRPLDATIADHFRAHRRLTEPDRAFVVEMVYGLLRRLPYFAALVRAAATDGVVNAREDALFELYLYAQFERLAAPDDVDAAVAALSGEPRRRLRALLEAARADRDLRSIEDDGARFAALHAWPEWVVAALRPRMAERELAALLDALNEPPPLALRANTSLASPREVALALEREGVATRPGRLAPDALLVEEPRNVFRTESFRRGLFEVQDEGSQVVSLLVDPKPGSRLLDACAGAGGKTLHLAALMKGRGEVFAYDPSARRLAAARKRVARSGLQNVRVLDSEEAYERLFARHRDAVGAVLVDAPCTGLGTVRRNPDIKARATPDLAGELARKQRDILETVSPLVRPGGRLVYATCSILAEENEAVVDGFLAAHPEFALVPVGRVAAEARVETTEALRRALEGAEYLSLTPNEHGTDGFFAAVLERRA